MVAVPRRARSASPRKIAARRVAKRGEVKLRATASPSGMIAMAVNQASVFIADSAPRMMCSFGRFTRRSEKSQPLRMMGRRKISPKTERRKPIWNECSSSLAKRTSPWPAENRTIAPTIRAIAITVGDGEAKGRGMRVHSRPARVRPDSCGARGWIAPPAARNAQHGL